jgi:hypothetical protein
MLEKTAKKMLSPINTAGVSILGFFNILLGIWISLPFDSLGYINNVPEWLVAAIMLIIGSFILSGSIGDKYRTLLVGTQLSFYWWFLSMGGLIYMSWQNVLWIFALMIAVYSLFVSVNIKVNRDNLPFKKL